jgi:hypothetical protein
VQTQDSGWNPEAAMQFEAQQQEEPEDAEIARLIAELEAVELDETDLAKIAALEIKDAPKAQDVLERTVTVTRGKFNGLHRGRIARHVSHIDDTWKERPAPNPPKYFKGKYRFKPIPSCVAHQEVCIAELGMYGYESYCLTCHAKLIEPELVSDAPLASEDAEPELIPADAEHVFGAASDHARTYHNHAVVVIHAGTKLPLWMSAYDVRKSHWM